MKKSLDFDTAESKKSLDIHNNKASNNACSSSTYTRPTISSSKIPINIYQDYSSYLKRILAINTDKAGEMTITTHDFIEALINLMEKKVDKPGTVPTSNAAASSKASCKPPFSTSTRTSSQVGVSQRSNLPNRGRSMSINQSNAMKIPIVTSLSKN